MSLPAPLPSLNIGFISTRFWGTDGVSLETTKWAEVLKGMGHNVFFFSGQSELPQEISEVVPEAFFGSPEVKGRHRSFFSHNNRSSEESDWVDKQKSLLKKSLRRFIKRFSLQVLIPQNVLSIPMHIPLGLAVTEVVAETGIPTIAHHHDFSWERKRFLRNCVGDYLSAAFPPNLRSLQHVVINSIARIELSSRRGIGSIIVPNVMNFESCEVVFDDYASDLRQNLGIPEDHHLILQPTRIIQRKGIEHAIEIVGRLEEKASLVITHASGDEGDAYACRVLQYAKMLGVPIVFAAHLMATERGVGKKGEKIYSLSDFYHEADLVTFPSDYEGFGNALLEAIHFHKPVVIQNYPVYAADIKPMGFEFIDFNHYITDDTIASVSRALTDKKYRDETTQHNHTLARRYYSYPILQYKLEALLANAFGVDGIQ